MSTVIIGCRLPSGIILDLGDPTKPSVELNGQRQAQENSPIVILSNDLYGTTEVDTEFWEAFKARVGAEFAPLKSGAIFEAKNEKEAKAKAKDLKEAPTGHEPLPQKTKDIEKA